MKKFIINSSVSTMLLAGFAQVALAVTDISTPSSAISTGGIKAFVNQINRIIDIIVPFLIGVGVFVVIYGVFGYIKNADNEEMRASGKQMMVWGVVAIFIMLSIWGLVTVLDNTFKLQKSSSDINFPKFMDSNSGGGSDPNYNSSYGI